MCLLLQTYHCSVDSHTCTKWIRVCNLMSHDNDLIFRHDKLSECLSLYTGFHTGILCCLLFLTAKVSNSITVFNHSLVSASCKCQVDRHTCILITQCISCSIQPQSDTQCRWSCISDIDLLHFLQKWELILFDLLITGFTQYNKILVLLQLLDDSIHFTDIFIDLPVDQCNKKWLSYFFDTFHHFIVVININQSCDHPLLFIFTDIGI